MTDQQAQEMIRMPARSDERDEDTRRPRMQEDKNVEAEAHRIGVEAVARALDQSV